MIFSPLTAIIVSLRYFTPTIRAALSRIIFPEDLLTDNVRFTVSRSAACPRISPGAQLMRGILPHALCTNESLPCTRRCFGYYLRNKIM